MDRKPRRMLESDLPLLEGATSGIARRLDALLRGGQLVHAIGRRFALEQAAQHDKRIQNRDAWEIGLAALPNAQAVRNVILPDDKVRELIAAAYDLERIIVLELSTR